MEANNTCLALAHLSGEVVRQNFTTTSPNLLVRFQSDQTDEAENQGFSLKWQCVTSSPRTTTHHGNDGALLTDASEHVFAAAADGAWGQHLRLGMGQVTPPKLLVYSGGMWRWRGYMS